MKRTRLLILSVVFIVLIVGCGGGGNSSTTPARSGTGRASFTIAWPERGRLIPLAANSIVVAVKQQTTTLAQQVLPRPANGGQSSLAFDTLPAGDLTVTATAYPNTNGSGTAQATATVPLVIRVNQTTNFSLTMASTIDHLELTAPRTFVIIGQTLALGVVAQNSAGSVVLLSPGKLQWGSSNSAAASVNASGLVTGNAAGDADISVSDSESGLTSNTVSLRSRLIRAFAYTPVDQNNIAQFEVGADGALTALNPPTVPTGLRPYAAVANPSSPFVYCINNYNSSVNGTVTQYLVNSDGPLSPLTPPSVQTEIGPYSVAIDPMGRALYVSNYLSRSVSQYKINSDGTLTPFSPASLPTAGVQAKYTAVDPSGHSLYVGTFGAGINQYAIGADGSLTYHSRLGSNHGGIAIHPNGSYAYAAGNASSNALCQMQVRGDGSLAYLSPANISYSGEPGYVAIDPAGKHLYDTVSFEGVYQYSIGTDGQVTALAPAALPGTRYVGAIYIHPNGQFAYTASSDPTTSINAIGQYRINADGTLSPLPQGTIVAGSGGPGGFAFVLQ